MARTPSITTTSVEGPVHYAVFVCDHAYDCEPLCREASEQEVIALIGTDALRAAQDECAWNGLGSKRLLVDVEPPEGEQER